MKDSVGYDERQLLLMLENLILFEKDQIDLCSSVGSLEFLLSSLETIDEKWEAEFLKEITTLETLNATEILKEAKDETYEVESCKRNSLINKAINQLKNIISIRLSG